MIRTFVLFIVLVFFSCSDKKRSVDSSSLVDKKTMVLVLADIHILEAAITLNLAKTDGEALKKNPQYAAIFANHSITIEQYQESMKYYISHKQEMASIYEDVLTELSKRQAGEGK